MPISPVPFTRRGLLGAASSLCLMASARALAGEKGELVVSQFSETRDLASIDPFRSLDFTIPNSLIFDPLLGRGRDGTLVSGLATAWERTAPTTWRFTLRTNARFHDGSTVRAGDTAATLNYALDPANRSGLRAQLLPLVRAEAPDDTTLVLHTAIASALLPDIVAAAPTLPAAQLADPNAPFRTAPVGSGPWRLEAWQPNARLVLAAAGLHWREPETPWRRVVVRVVPEASTRVADLLGGGAQVAADIPAALVARVRRSDQARLVAQPGARTSYLSFSFRPPFDDPRVRRAVYHGIDRRALVETLWGAEPATGPVSRVFGGYTEASPLSDYDPDRARALLREAGVSGTLAAELDAPPAELQSAQVIQGQLARAGFEVRINPVESPGAMLDPQRLAASDRGRLWIVTALDNHAQDAIRPFNAFYAGNGFLAGTAGYRPDPRLAPLLQAYGAAETRPDRQEAASKVMAVAKEDAPVVLLAFPRAVYGVAKTLEMAPTTLGHLDFTAISPVG